MHILHQLTTFSFPNPRGHSPIITGFPAPSSEPSGQASDCSGANDVNPVCLQKWYDIPSTSATGATNGIAVTGYEGENANFKDLTVFWEIFSTCSGSCLCAALAIFAVVSN